MLRAISLIVGFSAVIFALVLGVGLGLSAGYFGGKYEMIVMRLTDVQLTVPSILMALLVDGIARGIISRELHDEMAIYVLIFIIFLFFTSAIPNLLGLSTSHNRTVESKFDFLNRSVNSTIDF